ncbi:hypothetical protein GCM10022403_098370 [Streptomyces coacervatus]|uniref:Integral membrane protein n=1 Tax=Streptomyces coacervatus TaxID=647381 RepID=A0ABP7JR79_9ACTN
MNKVPEVTVYFWVIKVLCTTVGETAADLLMSALLAVVLVVQFRTSAYRAGVYWLAVALISVVGTLVSDNLTDNMGVPLETTTTVFAVLLAVVFVAWYRSERTLSMIAVARFWLGLDAVWSFWIAYVLTRPLGASVGDYLSQPTGDGGLGLGTVMTSTLFLTVILGLVVFLAITRKDVTKPNGQELQTA